MPLIKLGYLLIRTVAKPVANIIKEQTKNHQTFRTICVRLAQSYHRTEIRLLRGMNRKASKPGEIPMEARIKPLDQEKAIEVGANFLGEALVFIVAGVILILDNSRNVIKERQRRRAIDGKFEDLYNQLEQIKKHNNKKY